MRVFNDLTDIVLDAPNAYHTLSKFVESGTAAGFVSNFILEELPSRYDEMESQLSSLNLDSFFSISSGAESVMSVKGTVGLSSSQKTEVVEVVCVSELPFTNKIIVFDKLHFVYPPLNYYRLVLYLPFCV